MNDNQEHSIKKLILSDIVGETIRIIKKDLIILAPYLIFFLLLYTIEHALLLSKIDIKDYNLYFVIATWLLELIFKCFTISLGLNIYQADHCSISIASTNVVNHFFQFVYANGILSLPILVIFNFFLLKQVTPTLSASFLIILSFLVIVFISFIIEFVPTIILSQHQNWYKSIITSYFFVKNNFKKVFFFMFFIFIVTLLTFFISSIFSEIPLIGKSIFHTLIHGLSSAFICLFSLVFYLRVSGLARLS